MEFPNLGEHCKKSTCNKLDFLPIKCDACSQLFCSEHYPYFNHDCPYQKNVQVPVCPLCNNPVPVARGQLPDIVVGAHIDNECQADPAKSRRKVFINKCTVKGCKNKEIVRILCSECNSNFCLKHRHPTDHKCPGKLKLFRKEALEASLARRNNRLEDNLAGLEEDEALARALALSMEDSSGKHMTQEELDLALARQLQASDLQATNETRNSRDRCIVA